MLPSTMNSSNIGMKSFPTVYDLASASEETVNAHWAGLGFYRRARLLHKGSKLVVQNFDGELPQTVEGLMQIPVVSGSFDIALSASGWTEVTQLLSMRRSESDTQFSSHSPAVTPNFRAALAACERRNQIRGTHRQPPLLCVAWRLKPCPFLARSYCLK